MQVQLSCESNLRISFIRKFGEGGRVIEVYSDEQMTFLQSYLAQFEADHAEEIPDGPGWIWYWMGLNDRDEEGVWVWPSGTPAEYTNWDVEFEEPYPGKTTTLTKLYI